MDYQAMGRRIKELRKKKKLSQERLSELVDISPGFMSRIETGDKSGSFDTYIRIAKALDTTLDYISQDIIEQSAYNFRCQELLLYFDSLNHRQQQFVLENLRQFCSFLKEDA